MRTPFEFERERAEAGVLLPKGNKPERVFFSEKFGCLLYQAVQTF